MGDGRAGSCWLSIAISSRHTVGFLTLLAYFDNISSFYWRVEATRLLYTLSIDDTCYEDDVVVQGNRNTAGGLDRISDRCGCIFSKLIPTGYLNQP
jgi:hypothetical protein